MSDIWKMDWRDTLHKIAAMSLRSCYPYVPKIEEKHLVATGSYSTLPSFLQRVVDEKNALQLKLSALVAFFGTDRFLDLPEAERSRLRNQARFMDGYAAVLEERIHAHWE
jgi:hypothetical protein